MESKQIKNITIHSELSKKSVLKKLSLSFFYKGILIQILPPVQENGICDYISHFYINGMEESLFRIKGEKKHIKTWFYLNEHQDKETIELKTALMYLTRPWLVKNNELGKFIDDKLNCYLIDEQNILEKYESNYLITYIPEEDPFKYAELTRLIKEINTQRALKKLSIYLGREHKVIKCIAK